MHKWSFKKSNSIELVTPLKQVESLVSELNAREYKVLRIPIYGGMLAYLALLSSCLVLSSSSDY